MVVFRPCGLVRHLGGELDRGCLCVRLLVEAPQQTTIEVECELLHQSSRDEHGCDSEDDGEEDGHTCDRAWQQEAAQREHHADHDGDTPPGNLADRTVQLDRRGLRVHGVNRVSLVVVETLVRFGGSGTYVIDPAGQLGELGVQVGPERIDAGVDSLSLVGEGHRLSGGGVVTELGKPVLDGRDLFAQSGQLALVLGDEPVGPSCAARLALEVRDAELLLLDLGGQDSDLLLESVGLVCSHDVTPHVDGAADIFNFDVLINVITLMTKQINHYSDHINQLSKLNKKENIGSL